MQSELQQNYYEKEYPEKGDFVIVRVNEVNEDVGAYVSLLEYNNIEGMIPISEFTNRRVRSSGSLGNVMRVGKTEVALVLDIDEEKGYIDLSKSKAHTDDILKCEKKWNQAKFVQTVMISMSIKLSIPLSEIHQEITWPLYRKYGSAYNAFLMYISDINSVPEIDSFNNELGPLIKRRLESIYKFNAEINVTCLRYEGIDAIKDSIKSALLVYPSLSITLIASPSFLMSISVEDKDKGFSIMNDACDIIGRKIKQYGGNMSIMIPPYCLNKD